MGDNLVGVERHHRRGYNSASTLTITSGGEAALPMAGREGKSDADPMMTSGCSTLIMCPVARVLHVAAATPEA